MPKQGKFLKALPLVILALILSVTGLGAAMAQNTATPIIVGEPTPGQVSQLNIAPSFLYTAQGPEVITVVVESASGEFAPALRVLSSDNQLLQDVPNPANSPQLEAILQLPEGGQYVLQVQSANGQAGSFTITITEVEPIPEPLLVGDDLDVPFSPNDRTARYVFDSDEEDTLRLVVESEEPIDAIVTLSNEDGDELASFSLLLTGGTINIPPGIGQFLLTITYDEQEEPQDENVRVALLPPPAPEAEPTPVATAAPAPTRIPLIPLPANGPCIVASFSGGTVNLRSAPSTTFPVIATLSGNNVALVIGRLADASWYQVNYNGITAWVAGFVIRQGGLCGSVPIVPVPGSPTPVPGALPDVSVNGISVTPAGPDEDEDFAINVTVNNTGSVPANNVLVRLTFNAPGISISLPTSELNIGQIPAFSAVTVNFLGIRADNDGNVQANVTLDPNNAVPETNDGNNSGQLTFTVGSDLPDLVISDLDVDTEEGSTNVTVDFEVTNQGASEAEDFEVEVRFNNGDRRTFDFDSILSGDTESRSFSIDLDSFGDYEVTAEADSDGDVEESNEGNNESDEDFTLEDEATPTEEPTQPATEEPTQPATEEPTQPATEEPTQPATEEPTQPATEEPTQPATEEPTQPATEEPTEPATEEPTEPAPVDADNDTVMDDGTDLCLDTPANATVDSNGCPTDTDGDGVFDGIDACPGTTSGATVDATGCEILPVDSDGDNVPDVGDSCPGTLAGTNVNASGCPDTDADGVADFGDFCPATPGGSTVDATGCAVGETLTTDTDLDGVVDTFDQCPTTPSGSIVGPNGCAEGETPV